MDPTPSPGPAHVEQAPDDRPSPRRAGASTTDAVGRTEHGRRVPDTTMAPVGPRLVDVEVAPPEGDGGR